jgi:hypothetical protein
MNKLFKAIYEHFEADPLADVLTDLYDTQAPQDAVMPYGVVSMVDNTPDIDSSQAWENYLIQFNVFSKEPSAAEIRDIFEMLKGNPTEGEGFDFLNLVIDDYDTVLFKRQGGSLTKDEDGVWQYNVLYKLMTTYTGQSSTQIFVGKLYCLLPII